jgi:hypothetical protein
VVIPSFHNSCKSSIRGCKYTSMSFLSAVRLGIIKDNIIFGSFIDIHRSKLYGINTTSHMLYVVLILLNKPSLTKPSHTLWESRANHSCSLSNFFHARPLTGCPRVLLSSFRSSLCHLICLVISFDINNHCNLNFIRKYCKTF